MHDAYFLKQPSDVLARWALLAQRLGPIVTRYGLVFLLVLFGAMKWTAAEAAGIRPLISHSPVWSWLYGPLGVQGTSIFFGIFELAAALAIGLRPWFPLISGLGSTFGVVMFLTTLSFLITTPGLISDPSAGFILKDIVLLGAAVWTAGEAFAATTAATRPQ